MADRLVGGDRHAEHLVQCVQHTVSYTESEYGDWSGRIGALTPFVGALPHPAQCTPLSVFQDAVRVASAVNSVESVTILCTAPHRHSAPERARLNLLMGRYGAPACE
ncbi:MAG TPA: hypothetical protein VI653_14645 [Steroidobacteraceae bacterium]